MPSWSCIYFFCCNHIINELSIFLYLGVVQVQQKVLGIIPSTTGASQTFTSFQPRTATVTIRPNTTGTLGTTSTSQVRCFSDDVMQKKNIVHVFKLFADIKSSVLLLFNVFGSSQQSSIPRRYNSLQLEKLIV